MMSQKENRDEDNSLSNDIKIIRRGLVILNEISPKLIWLEIITSIFNAIIPYISIYMSAKIITELIGARNLNKLISYVVITVGATFIVGIISSVFGQMSKVKEAVLDQSMEIYLNSIAFKMDFSRLERNETTELRDKIRGNMFVSGGGIKVLVESLRDVIGSIVSIILAVVLSFKALTIYSTKGTGILGIVNRPWFSLVMVLMIALCIFITMKNSYTERCKKFEVFSSGAKWNRYYSYYSFEYLDDDKAAKDVRIFNQSELLMDETEEKGRIAWWNISKKSCELSQKYSGINNVISVFMGSIVYIFVGLKALAGLITVGAVTQTYGAILRMITAFSNLSYNLTALSDNNRYLKLLFDYIDIPSEMNNGTIKLEKNIRNGYEIEFHNVSFKYPDTDKYVLKNLNLKISSGEHLAIVGMNGSGKTTMVKLLCRLYTPDSGYITLNSIDIQKYEYDEYLSLFSVVFQDFRFLAFQVGQNIAANVNFDDEKVWHCLEMAGAKEYIQQLPKQLNHSIYKHFEEDGVDVSGGEEQKLAIARALYKDSPFVIFDEPTAAMDPIAEVEIYSKFNQITAQKSAIYISHRLSSCIFCDKIAVFHGGELIQLGTHDELHEDKSGKYYELWSAQAQYYDVAPSTKCAVN